jgi:hypothetical protein
MPNKQNLITSIKTPSLKLLKTNAAIWFNKICRDRQLQPRYMNIKIKGRKQQDMKTATSAIRFRINQEIKFHYKRKQHFNQQLYQAHLKCAHHYYGMWQHIQTMIDRQLKKIMENQYQKLNKKQDTLIKSNPKQHNMQKTTQFQPKVIILLDKHFTKEQINILSLGPKHAIKKEPKKYINELIVDTEVRSTFKYFYVF